MTASLLVVDDDASIRKIVSDRLRALGYRTESASDGEEALQRIEAWEPDLLVLDLQMPRKDGFAVLEALSGRPDRPAVIVLTAHGSIDAAVRAVKMGAEDLLTKPFDAAQLEHVIRTVLERRGLKQRVARLETELSERHTFVSAVTGPMRETYQKALRAGASDATLLLTGGSDDVGERAHGSRAEPCRARPARPRQPRELGRVHARADGRGRAALPAL
jgi:DNA-binding NtrC family response regulator